MDDNIRMKLREAAEAFVTADQPERATLAELYGEGWGDEVDNPRGVGREFRQMVNGGEIVGLRALHRNEWENQNNHVEYVRDA